jgi:hypothetical protein
MMDAVLLEYNKKLVDVYIVHNIKKEKTFLANITILMTKRVSLFVASPMFPKIGIIGDLNLRT